MKIEVEIIYHVKLILCGGQGFCDEIRELGIFDTKEEAQNCKAEYLKNHSPWGEVKIIEEIIGL